MKYDTQTLKKLRDESGVSIMACKKSLEEAEGDYARALEILKKASEAVAVKKSERETKSGVVDAYVHSNKKIGVLVELRSETDFVARNPEFQKLAHDIAMQIAATSPESIEDLLVQESIRDPKTTIGESIKQAIQKFGENIEISHIERLAL
ncbi:MAG: elongation factor Ts [Candidatus Niyogibacteria bacterium CG10_big_fil_rev_8_21_14_0_10_42_19]|uniref:Elongation factor Ts n=1 Tax=Candidatus Niyogibacteria bacterium CG10_big_fil_rev_8_21_14_0_10_42_19 TaxID=1974725 RepID=A0A2H0TEY8_9BACT|nr:MAG: elongation factor Ts [Candidatus Niyogibacteria bacterium CG10_big_fil_rev_8_21_14_0_10_42_19]